MVFRSIYLLLGVLICGDCLAQPVPKLNSISRSWIQRGTSADLELNGENLAGARQIIISGATGVEASIRRESAGPLRVESTAEGISAVSAEDPKKLLITLKLSPAAALVERELRVVTGAGVSNPVQFRTGDLPEVQSRRDNVSAEKAQPIELPAAVNGVISAAAQSDYFKFQGKKGEALLFDLYAQRLGGSELDSSLAVLGPDGRELARNEDEAGLDSILEFNVPEDGEYLLEVRDFRYQGGGNYRYRLHAGALPRVSRIFPFGGQRGQRVEVELDGVNLDGTSKLALELAPDAQVGRQEIRAATPRGLSNPFLFAVSELPQVVENATNEETRVEIPVVIHGRLEKEKDSDLFIFKAEKGQRVVFDVDAFGFGSPVDALLTLMDAEGKVLQRNDDADGADARIDHRFGEAGEYRLKIQDLLHRGGNQFAYRISASVPQPDFRLVFLPDAPRVRRGGRVPVRVEINRSNGFGGPVTVTADLPDGLHSEPLLVPAGSGSGLLVISAAGDAPMGAFPLKMTGRATLNGGTVERPAQPLSGENEVKEGFVTVLDSAPFALFSPTLMAGIEQNQAGKIEVILERRNGFRGEIKIVPEGFSAGREPIMKSFEFQPLVIKGGEDRGELVLKAKLDAEINSRPIILKGEAEVGGIVYSEYSSLIPVGTAEIPFVLTTSLKKLVVTALPGGSESAAAEAVFEIRAQRRGGFSGPIELKLEGVPENVAVNLTNILANEGATTVKLVASETAPAGKEFQISIKGSGTHNDRLYRFEPAPVTLTINAPESAAKLAGAN